MNMLWLLRMKRWADNPPSCGQVKLVFGILLASALLYAYEYFYGWPDFLTLEPIGRGNRLPRF
jgi:hypothetical protein